MKSEFINFCSQNNIGFDCLLMNKTDLNSKVLLSAGHKLPILSANQIWTDNN